MTRSLTFLLLLLLAGCAEPAKMVKTPPLPPLSRASMITRTTNEFGCWVVNWNGRISTNCPAPAITNKTWKVVWDNDTNFYTVKIEVSTNLHNWMVLTQMVDAHSGDRFTVPFSQRLGFCRAVITQ